MSSRKQLDILKEKVNKDKEAVKTADKNSSESFLLPTEDESSAAVEVLDKGEEFKDPTSFFNFEEAVQEGILLPPPLSDRYTDVLHQILKGENPYITTEDEYQSQVEYFYNLAEEERENLRLATATELAERGYSVSQVSSWYNAIKKAEKEKQEARKDYGLYEALSDSYLTTAASSDNVSATLATDPEELEETTKITNQVANIQYLKTISQQADEAFLEDGFIAQAIKGVSTGALIPFIDSLQVEGYSTGALRGELEKQFGKYLVLDDYYYNVTDFYNDLGTSLLLASREMAPRDFSKAIDSVNGVLSTLSWGPFEVTKEDVSDFWGQIISPNRILNKVVAGIDLVPALGLVGKAAKAGKTLKSVSKAVRPVIEERSAKAAKEAFDAAYKEEIDKLVAKGVEVTPEAREAALKVAEKVAKEAEVKATKEAEASFKKDVGKKATLGAANLIVSEALPGVLTTAKVVAMAATSPLKLAKAIGDKARAIRILSKDMLKRSEAAFDSTEAHVAVLREDFNNLQEVIPSALQPSVVKDGVSIAESSEIRAVDGIVDAIGKQEQLTKARTLAGEAYRVLKETGSLGKLYRETLSGVEKSLLIDVQKAVDSQSNRASVMFVNTAQKPTGLEVTLRLGSGTDNTQPLTKEAAKNLAASLKVDEDTFFDGFKSVDGVKVTRDANGYYVDVTRRFKKEEEAVGYATVSDFAEADIKRSYRGKWKDKASSNRLYNNIVGLNQSSPSFVRVLNNLLQKDEGIGQRILENFTSAINKGNQYVLEKLIRDTRKEGEWFSSKYLKDIGCDEKTIKAYEAVKNLEDLDYLLYMDNLVSSLKAEGMLNIGLKSGKIEHRLGLGKEIKDFDSLTGDIYSVNKISLGEDGTLQLEGSLMPASELKKEIKGDVGTTFKMFESVNGSNYVNIPKHLLSVSEISATKLKASYKPGRLLFSQGSTFIKQAVTGTNAKGSKYVKRISTLFAHHDTVAVNMVVKALEEARQLAISVNKGIMDMREAERAYSKIKNIGMVRYSFGDFYKACVGDNKFISLEPGDILEAVEDGMNLKSLSPSDNEFFNFKGASMFSYSSSAKIAEKRARQDARVFNPFTLDDAPRMSLAEEVATTIGRIHKYSSANHYRKAMVESLYSSYRDFFKDLRSAEEALLYGPSNEIKKASSEVANQIDHHRRIYQTMLSHPTDFDKSIEKIFSKVAHWLVPDYAGKGGIRTKAYTSLRNLDPVSKTRAFAFHWFLGMYNPRQLYKQVMSNANVIAMSPIHGTKATALAVPLLIYSMTADKSILKRLSKQVSIPEGTLQEIAESANKLDVASRGTYSGALDIGAKTWKRWDLSSTFFFDMGERINRYTTAIATRLEIGKSLLKASNAEIANAITRQQNLYLNMGKAGMSPLQTGLTALVTQFQGPMFRYLEALTDRTLTAQEKISLFFVPSILGGTKGLLGARTGSSIYASFVNDEDTSWSNPEVQKAMYLGLIDYYIESQGGRVAVGGDIFDYGLLDNIMGLAAPLEAPSISALKQGGTALGLLLGTVADFMNSPMSQEDFRYYLKRLNADISLTGAGPSSFVNLNKANWIWQEGTLRNRNGEMTEEDLDTMDAVLKALGVRDLQSSLAMLSSSIVEDFDKSVKDTSEEIERLFNSAASTTDESLRKRLLDDASVLLKILRHAPGHLQEAVYERVNTAWEKAGTNVQKELLEGMLKRTGNYEAYLSLLKNERERNK